MIENKKIHIKLSQKSSSLESSRLQEENDIKLSIVDASKFNVSNVWVLTIFPVVALANFCPSSDFLLDGIFFSVFSTSCSLSVDTKEFGLIFAAAFLPLNLVSE